MPSPSFSSSSSPSAADVSPVTKTALSTGTAHLMQVCTMKAMLWGPGVKPCSSHWAVLCNAPAVVALDASAEKKAAQWPSVTRPQADFCIIRHARRHARTQCKAFTAFGVVHTHGPRKSDHADDGYRHSEYDFSPCPRCE